MLVQEGTVITGSAIYATNLHNIIVLCHAVELSLNALNCWCSFYLVAVAYHDRAAGKDRTVHMMGAGKGQVNFLIRLDQQTAYQYYE